MYERPADIPAHSFSQVGRNQSPKEIPTALSLWSIPADKDLVPPLPTHNDGMCCEDIGD